MESIYGEWLIYHTLWIKPVRLQKQPFVSSIKNIAIDRIYYITVNKVHHERWKATLHALLQPFHVLFQFI